MGLCPAARTDQRCHDAMPLKRAVFTCNYGMLKELLTDGPPQPPQEGKRLAYPWWREKRDAPDYAGHVDRHNKPDYDPCNYLLVGLRDL